MEASLKQHIWRSLPQSLKFVVRLFRIYLDYYFADKLILQNQNDFYSLCKELNNQGLIYVTLEPDKDGIPDNVSFLVQEREQISMIVNSRLVQTGKRSFFRKQIFINIFTLDGGSQPRLDYEFGSRVLKERIYDVHLVPVISPELKTALFVHDILFFFEYNLCISLTWISIPSKSIRNRYRNHLNSNSITDFSFANLITVLANFSSKPNLDYLLFQSLTHPQLLNFTQLYLDKYRHAPKGLSVFCILDKYSTEPYIDFIISYLEENGFIDIQVIPLDEFQSSLATIRFRGGNWSVGNKLYGAVRVLIAFIDPKPIMPKSYIFGYKLPIDNLRLKQHKEFLRILLNSEVPPLRGTPPLIHSSDLASQALYYLLELGIDYGSR